MSPDSALPSDAEPHLTADEARAIGAEAFVFGFPLLLTLTSKEHAAQRTPLAQGQAPLNRFGHFDRFPSPEFREMVALNPDTLYSLAWLDLASEPIVLDLPDTGGRSYMVSIVSAWTDSIACLSPRAPGFAGGSYALCRDERPASLPPGVERLDAPTDVLFVAAHLHAHAAEDLADARAVQRQLTLTPLSAYAGVDRRSAEDVFDPPSSATNPLEAMMETSADELFSWLSIEMRHNPPAKRDEPVLRRIAALGLRPGETFEWDERPPEIRAALEAGVADGKALVTSPPPQEQLANGWQTVGPELGTPAANYVRRAQNANLAFGAVPPEDACFPVCTADADGQPTSGAHRYLLRFGRADVPEVDGLWSLALYDMDQLCVANPLGRYALGDRDDLKMSADGSLEIAIQHEQPDGDGSNWLPSPDGDFCLMLHMYCPSSRMLDGSWSIPPVVRID